MGSRMSDRSQESLQAEALQQALERHSGLLAEGTDSTRARAHVASELGGEVGSLFSLAVGISDAAAPIPAPQFADQFETKLRRTRIITAEEREAKQHRARRRRQFLRLFEMPQFGFAAAAAAIAIFAGLLVPAFSSIPGDSLYALKRATETARLAVVSGPREAHLRVRLADERFEEVEHLVERGQLREVGPGLAAVGVQDIKDPKIARLIEETLADAHEQLEVAAKILIARPRGNTQALDDLVVVSQRGRRLAAEVAEELPTLAKPPVMNSVVRFAKIEAEAKAAQMTAEQAEQTPPPCATPTPTTDASASPTAESATPTPTATTTPQPTPCVSPSPTPTPTPTATPTPTPSPEPASASAATPTPAPAAQGGTGGERSRTDTSWRSPRPASTSEPTGA